MPDSIANGRAFNYDIASLLAYLPPPPPVSEVVMTISGMTGSNWCGMGNGSHDLDGTETLNPVGGSTGTSDHIWSYGGSPLRMINMLYFSGGSVYFSSLYWRLTYGGSYKTSLSCPSTATQASVRGFCFNSTTISGVTFTWSQGTDWSRGGM